MLHRISKMADLQKVGDCFISDLPFLWSLVDDPPTNSRISWSYLVKELPALLTQYRSFCPITGKPIYRGAAGSEREAHGASVPADYGDPFGSGR